MLTSVIRGDKLIKVGIAFGLAWYILPKIRNRLWSYLQPRFMSEQHEIIRDLKEDVFEFLKSYRQNMMQPEQPIRILEIGAGDGLNLDHYPDHTKLVVVDPQRHFRSQMEKKIETINFNRRNLDSASFEPSLKLEAWYALKAENMIMFCGDAPNPAKIDGKIESVEDQVCLHGDYPSGLFNAIVSTYVLCSVDNVERVLLNATSLVQPGGLLLMIEHIKPDDKWSDYFCFLIQPLWGLVFGSCRLRRTPHMLLKNHPKLSKAWEILYCVERNYGSDNSIAPIKHHVGLVARRMIAI